jgi:hypothetical protein
LSSPVAVNKNDADLIVQDFFFANEVELPRCVGRNFLDLMRAAGHPFGEMSRGEIVNRFLPAVVFIGLLGIGSTPSIHPDAWNIAPLAKTVQGRVRPIAQDPEIRSQPAQWISSAAAAELSRTPGPYLIGLAALYSLGICAVLRAIHNSRRW